MRATRLLAVGGDNAARLRATAAGDSVTAAVLAPPRRAPLFRRRSGIPGFGLTMGLTLTILSCLVLIPLSAAVIKAAGLGPVALLKAAFSHRALNAYRLSFGAAFIAAAINGVLGLLTA